MIKTYFRNLDSQKKIKPIRMKQENIRVRFAPSPTGPLHIGGVRTALYNYLFARKMGGKLILRIEDTDQNRFVPGAEQYILESLNWCGILFDEDVVQGGPYAPYRQSERSEIYKEYIRILLEKGHAYYAFDTEAELELRREKAKAEGRGAFQYDFRSRVLMQNALTLSEAEVASRIKSGHPYVIRIKIPENETIHLRDMIRGEVSVHTANLDDKVLFKSDGLPTYHLANVVDDYLMKITHVIRGEEWLPSAPLHVLLYRFFGWEGVMPQFAHLPLILKPDGNGKLSKRDGDRLGFPVFPIEWKDPKTKEIYAGFRETGYIPEAFINILVHLGWNPGTEQELFSMEELIAQFSLNRIGKSGSKFDPEKAKWFNHQYLIRKSDEELAEMFQPILEQYNFDVPFGKLVRIVGLVKERLNFVHEIWEQASFFFERPLEYDQQTVSKFWKEDTAAIMNEVTDVVSGIEKWDVQTIEHSIKEFITAKGYGMGKVMNAVRLSLVGASKGPGVADICEVLGKDETIQRFKQAVAILGK